MAWVQSARVHSAACHLCPFCRWPLLHITTGASKMTGGGRECSRLLRNFTLLLLLSGLFGGQGVLLLHLHLLQFGLIKVGDFPHIGLVCHFLETIPGLCSEPRLLVTARIATARDLVYLLSIFSCSYHWANIKCLLIITMYFKLIKTTLITYKNSTLLGSPPHIFYVIDITIFFIYCVSINKCLSFKLFLIFFFSFNLYSEIKSHLCSLDPF